jgi:hypothetical protein
MYHLGLSVKEVESQKYMLEDCLEKVYLESSIGKQSS